MQNFKIANPNLYSFQAGKRIKPIFQGQDMLDTADIPFLYKPLN